MLVLVAAALASTPDLDSDLPYATFGRKTPGLWIGATPPTFVKPAQGGLPMAIGVEANVRLGTPLPWLQPELRIAHDRAFDVYGELSGRVDLRAPSETVLTLGPRLGADRGVYGGVSGGVNLLHNVGIDVTGLQVEPALTAYGGYTFHLADGMRGGPELTVGTRNTFGWRMEWGL